MLNCLHFQTCLSSLCLSPPPPDKQCPLEKVRQIGRDVRHTSDCKVKDADLQDYFKTLSTLLADPQYLQHDPSAIIACTRLSDLQNDRMSFEELGKLLKEVNQTLEEAKKTGERFSEMAEKTLSKHLQKLDATNQLGLIRLKKKTTVGEQRLHSKTKVGEHRLERKTQFGAQIIYSRTRNGEQRIEKKTNDGKHRLERKTQFGAQIIYSRTRNGEQRIEQKTNDADQCIDSMVHDGTQRIEISVQHGIERMQQAANKTAQGNYERDVADSSSSVSSTLPVCIVLNSANQAQCADPQPVLPCIKHIEFYNTCSSTWLRSLLSTLLTLDHYVKFILIACYITSCKEDPVRWEDTETDATLLSFKDTLTLMNAFGSVSRGLWEALHGLNIKSLSLSVGYGLFNETYADSMSQLLSSLTQLDKLSIVLNNDSPGLWEALHGLNIKRLSVWYGGFKVKYPDSMSQSLSSLTHLDTLSIKSCDDIPGLWEALRGLNIKSLSLSGRFGGFKVNSVDSMSQSLSSLTHLDKLSIKVYDHIDYIPGLWEALHGLNIKSLSLSFRNIGLKVKYADSMSQSLSSLTHLDTLSINAADYIPGLWEALHGLNIKSLSLSGRYGGFDVKSADSMSQSLLSLTYLDTLSICTYVDSPGLLEALHGLNIKSLSLSAIEHAESIARSLSSLKQLETLSVFWTYIDIKLPQSLKHLNSYCMVLLPSELRDLVDALSACTQTIESNLDFCCASLDDSTFKRIPPEEYIVVKKELEMRKNVEVKRFQILDRTIQTDVYVDDDDAASDWSVRDIGGVHDGTKYDDNVKDVSYKEFDCRMSREIITRISMRLLITPSSNS
ncbi:uncharacterized protein LOC127838087 isoform X4 [Dreissena polymorpha]|uniref:uncharacterized protein LOC127838087 isoform X4 n=1 Tax=Dreissena polymorpha TaxID=45954 RepID=UPI002263BD49|nr:uncharacterized protein LOC127838087 isoform X4 [Dreissena polymorpha]